MSTNLIKVLKVLLGDEQFVNPIRNDTTRVGSLLTKKFSLIWRRIQSLVESGILSIFGIRDIKQGGGGGGFGLIRRTGHAGDRKFSD